MRKVEQSRTERIAWVVSGLFLVWTGLAVLAAAPGCELLRGLFSAACHQEPDRCYTLFGHPIGLCVRCFWIYLGLAAGHSVFARLNVSEKNALRLVLAATALMALDVGLERMGVYHNWKALRAVTGGLFGFAVSWFTLQGLSQWLARPHPNPMASQARHEMVSPQETIASRNVVPRGEGTVLLCGIRRFGVGTSWRGRASHRQWKSSEGML